MGDNEKPEEDEEPIDWPETPPVGTAELPEVAAEA